MRSMRADRTVRLPVMVHGTESATIYAFVASCSFDPFCAPQKYPDTWPAIVAFMQPVKKQIEK